jgi:hypothetical protein
VVEVVMSVSVRVSAVVEVVVVGVVEVTLGGGDGGGLCFITGDWMCVGVVTSSPSVSEPSCLTSILLLLEPRNV